MDKPIQITEQDLHMLVEDAVRNYLKEERVDEFFGGLKNMMGAAGNAMSNMYQGAKQAWNTGEIQSKIQKLNQMEQQYNQQIQQMSAQRDKVKQQIIQLQQSIGQSQAKINQNNQQLANRRGGMMGANNMMQ